jgi:uracil-DNA glycosylase
MPPRELTDSGPTGPPLEFNPAPELIRNGASLRELREAAAGCKACPLYAEATQTVFGEGATRSPMVLIGEQPGDHEDKEGSPFVGPAGQILWNAVAEAGIDATDVYATNAVKHFKWTQGKWKRLHAKPNRREVEACLPWLEAEVARLNPSVIVGLGATACQAMLGPGVRVTKDRGKTAEWLGHVVVITYHPSAILRAPDEDARSQLMAALIDDLKAARACSAPGP